MCGSSLSLPREDLSGNTSGYIVVSNHVPVPWLQFSITCSVGNQKLSSANGLGTQLLQVVESWAGLGVRLKLTHECSIQFLFIRSFFVPCSWGLATSLWHTEDTCKTSRCLSQGKMSVPLDFCWLIESMVHSLWKYSTLRPSEHLYQLQENQHYSTELCCVCVTVTVCPSGDRWGDTDGDFAILTCCYLLGLVASIVCRQNYNMLFTSFAC